MKIRRIVAMIIVILMLFSTIAFSIPLFLQG